MLDAIVPRGVFVAESFGALGAEAPLFPAEETAVAGAAAKRRAEFAAVRACARRAMTSAGFEPGPVPRGPAGAPVWPDGLVGSMTHCEGYRACAIGSAGAFAAIGIDAEPDQPLPAQVLPMVASESERAALAVLAAEVPGVRWTKILFSAKEAVFKAWSTLSGRWLGFADARLTLDAGGTFAAQVPARPAEVGPAIVCPGRWMIGDGLIVTAVVVPAARRISHPSR
jgi:4'-phosphopantetheinyl transferase EntD